MFDELKKNAMSILHIDENRYWKMVRAYSNNFLGSEDEVLALEKYIETKNPDVLDMKLEFRIAKDLFGGYKYGNSKQ